MDFDKKMTLQQPESEGRPLMRCGCVAQARDQDGNWCCPTHIGLVEGAEQVVPEDELPDLEGRTARCAYFCSCDSEVPSSFKLAFFEHEPDLRHDRYYCGCRGWD